MRKSLLLLMPTWSDLVETNRSGGLGSGLDLISEARTCFDGLILDGGRD